jgi:hypothetical protein
MVVHVGRSTFNVQGKQLAAWMSLVLGYSKRSSIAELNIDEIAKSTLFDNKAIGRSLDKASIIVVLDHVASTGTP